MTNKSLMNTRENNLSFVTRLVSISDLNFSHSKEVVIYHKLFYTANKIITLALFFFVSECIKFDVHYVPQLN